MNKLRVAIFATALASGAVPALADDGPAKPVGEMDTKVSAPAPAKQTPPLTTKTDKQKAFEAATHASEEKSQKATRGVMVGDFPPYYGKSVAEWQAERQRRWERLEKMTPQEQDNKSAEWRRQTERWKKEAPGGSDPK
jgi:hypothetical protein